MVSVTLATSLVLAVCSPATSGEQSGGTSAVQDRLAAIRLRQTGARACGRDGERPTEEPGLDESAGFRAVEDIAYHVMAGRSTEIAEDGYSTTAVRRRIFRSGSGGVPKGGRARQSLS